MANQEFKRTPGKGKFAYLGINLVRPPDLMPAGRAPFLLNVSPDQETGAMNPRPGLDLAASASTFSGLVLPLHSYALVGANVLSGEQGPLRYIGQGTSLYTIPTSGFGAYTGFSGNPLSLVSYRPPQSPNSWLYVFDSIKQAKYTFPIGLLKNFAQNIGIFPPIAAPTTALVLPLNQPILDATVLSIGGWTNTGAAGTCTIVARMPSPTTSFSITFDVGAIGWASVVPVNGAASYASITIGSRISLNVEVCTIWQTLPALAASTVAGVAYDSGSSGMATLQATTPLQGVQRNHVIIVNGTSVRVLGVTRGPDGFYSVRCVLPSGIAATQTITIPYSFRVYTQTAGHVAGEVLASQMLQSTMSLGGATSATGIIANATVSIDLTQIGGRPLVSEDYIHCAFIADNIQNVQEIHFMLDIDATTNNFTKNYYYYVVRQNDFQQTSQGGATATQSLLQAITTNIANEYETGSAAINPTASLYPSGSLLNFGVPDTDQLGTGISQFFDAIFKINDMVRVGTDPSVNLSKVKAIGVMAVITGNVTIQIGSWFAAGTYGPDSNYNSYGNQGYPIQYRYRYRSSLTGAISDVSPATRSGELPFRTGINVSVTASPDTQVDLIDIERWGGSFDSWHRCLIVPNTTGTYLDAVTETIALGGDPLELLQYQPWPITGKQQTGTCDIVGTHVQVSAPSFGNNPGNQFNMSWIRGVEIIVNNQTYSLYAPPSSTTTLETAENIGVMSGVGYIIPEPTMIGQPLPYVAGPWDGRLWGTGDTLNPGLLYFTNSYNPDTASDQGYIEVCGPNEPLGMPVVYSDAVYVLSNAGLYKVVSTPGQANPYAAFRLGSIPSGQIAPWFVLRDANSPFLAWGGNDGIYIYTESGAINSTKEDLLPLFPFESRPGLAVTVAGLTLYPPDLTQEGRQNQLRLSFADGHMYFDYLDIQGNPRTLVYTVATQGWIPRQYVKGASLHYQEQGGLMTPIGVDYANSTTTVVGGMDGALYNLSPDVTDNGTAFNCAIVTPADDQGDTRARKQYGDLMLDIGGTQNVIAGKSEWSASIPTGSMPITAGTSFSQAVSLPIGTAVTAFFVFIQDTNFIISGFEVPPIVMVWSFTVPRDSATYTVSIPISNPVGPSVFYLNKPFIMTAGDHITIHFVSTNNVSIFTVLAGFMSNFVGGV